MFVIVGIYLFQAVAALPDSNPTTERAMALAQQVLTTVATLVVAVSGFYFGTSSAARGAQIASDAARGARGDSLVAITTAPALQDGVEKTDYSVQFEADGGRQPYKWTLIPSHGTPPPGLLLNAASGVFEGTPTQAGTYRFTVQVIDQMKDSDVQEYRLTINAAPDSSSVSPASGP